MLNFLLINRMGKIFDLIFGSKSALWVIVVLGFISFSGQLSFANDVSVEISVDQTTVLYGDPVTISWVAKNARNVRIVGIGFVEKKGSMTIHPYETKNTTYKIIARNGLFQRATDSVTVKVYPRASLNILPIEIYEGESAELRWSIYGAVSAVINPEPGTLEISNSDNYKETATISPSQSTTYTLTAKNDSGNITTRTVHVYVKHDRDTDRDGVIDKIDKCPGSPGGFEVDSNGCADVQKDTDGDGVNDYVEEISGTSPTDKKDTPTSGSYYQYDSLGRIKSIVRLQ